MSHALELFFQELAKIPYLQRMNCEADAEAIQGVFIYQKDMTFYKIRIEPIFSTEKERKVKDVKNSSLPE